MSVATGSKSALCFKEETTYATAPAGNWESMSFNTESLVESINQIISNEVKADRTVGSVRGGNIMAGGSISMDLYSAKMGFWLRHLLAPTATSATITVAALSAAAVTRGTYVTSNSKLYLALNDGTVTAGDVTTGLTHTSGEVTLGAVTWLHVGASSLIPYSHTITGNPDFVTGGIAFEKRVFGSTANTYFSYLGGRIGSLGIQVPQEGIVTADLAFLFKTANPASLSSIAGTPTTVVDDPVTGGQTEIRINSVVQTVVQSANINIANNHDANVYVVGSRQRKDLPAGRREISGSLTLFFEDLAAYTLFKNETSFPLRFSAIHAGNVIQIDLPECKFVGGTPTPTIAGNGTVTSTFNFQAFKDNAAHDIQVILKNLNTSI